MATFSHDPHQSVVPTAPSLVSNSLTVSMLWPLDRYARLTTQHDSQQVHGDSSSQWKNYDRTEHPQLNMSLIESNHLLITSGHQILESILLWEAQKWIKVFAKGDSLLFISSKNKKNRRFRVKIASPSKGISGIDACRKVMESLKGIVPVDDISTPSVEATMSQTAAAADMSQPHTNTSVLMETAEAMQTMSQPVSDYRPYIEHGIQSSQEILPAVPNQQQQDMPVDEDDTSSVETTEAIQLSQQEDMLLDGTQQIRDKQLRSTPPSLFSDSDTDSQLNMPVTGSHGNCDHEVSINVIGQNIMLPRELDKTSVHTHFPTEQLPQFIRLCLSDPEFPVFVEAVQREFNNLTK